MQLKFYLNAFEICYVLNTEMSQKRRRSQNKSGGLGSPALYFVFFASCVIFTKRISNKKFLFLRQQQGKILVQIF